VNRTRLLALRIYVGRIFRQTAPMSHLHYLPLAPGFFTILVGFFLIVLILRYEASKRRTQSRSKLHPVRSQVGRATAPGQAVSCASFA